METFRQHLDLANERFDLAEELMRKEKHHTAAHLFVNAAISYHNALCQKYLHKIPSHKQHSDTSYFRDLARVMKSDLPAYKEAYSFLMARKNLADYGTNLSIAAA